MSADALLKSILATPDDDLPRLVYADWLDEHGDPARAEFIRTQIELAKLPDHDPRYRALEDREHELLSEHEAGWIGGEAIRLREWEWRRGFLGQISTCVDGVGVLEAEPVALLNLHTSVGADESDEHHRLTRLPFARTERVQVLDTTAHYLTSAGTVRWVSAEEWPSLRELRLPGDQHLSELPAALRDTQLRYRLRGVRITPRSHGGGSQPGTLHPRDFALSLAATSLTHLGVPDTGLTSDGLHTLLSAAFAGTLRHLDVSDNPIAPDAYRAFQQCHPSMRLDKLDVSGTPLAGISLEPLLAARSLESLTKLEMNGCGSARRNMEVLAHSAFWNQATELRAHSGTIPASTLEPLGRSAGPPGLRLLDLADNYLRTEGVRMVCDSPWAGSLTWLALSRNYLDDESCEVLAKSGRLTHLRTLHLAHNNFTQDGGEGERITSRGVTALAESPSLANLRLLTLSYTGITDAAVDVVVNGPFWRLFGLGIGGCNLSPAAVRALANSPRLSRFVWLDVSDNPRLRGQALRPLAESPFLSRMCELDCGGIDIDGDVRALLRDRLGPRFSH